MLRRVSRRESPLVRAPFPSPVSLSLHGCMGVGHMRTRAPARAREGVPAGAVTGRDGVTGRVPAGRGARIRHDGPVAPVVTVPDVVTGGR